MIGEYFKCALCGDTGADRTVALCAACAGDASTVARGPSPWSNRPLERGWRQATARDQLVAILSSIAGLAGNINESLSGPMAAGKIVHQANQALDIIHAYLPND